MYRILRDAHLLLGLFSCAFLLMYGVSSVQMAHHSWFNLKPTVSESKLALPSTPAEARAVARELMDKHGVRGEIQQVRVEGDTVRFRIVRPGTVYEVDFSDENKVAKIRTNVAGFLGMLNRIHHVSGLWHEFTLLNVWGAMVGVISAGLILLALTGIYLWFKIHKERVVGGVLLALSLGYSLTLMVLMRLA